MKALKIPFRIPVDVGLMMRFSTTTKHFSASKMLVPAKITNKILLVTETETSTKLSLKSYPVDKNTHQVLQLEAFHHLEAWLKLEFHQN